MLHRGVSWRRRFSLHRSRAIAALADEFQLIDELVEEGHLKYV